MFGCEKKQRKNNNNKGKFNEEKEHRVELFGLPNANVADEFPQLMVHIRAYIISLLFLSKKSISQRAMGSTNSRWNLPIFYQGLLF